MKKKVVSKLQQKVKVKVDIVTDDVKIYYTGKIQDFTARYITNSFCLVCLFLSVCLQKKINIGHNF